MAKKSTQASGKKGQGRSPAFTVYVRIDPTLGAAFKQAIQSIRPRTDMTGVIEMLIERWLSEQNQTAPQDAAE